MTYEAFSDTEASYMAWIVMVPPSARHPQVRFQVCYQEGKRHRSAGIFPTERRALAEKRALEHRQREQAPAPADLNLERARTLFGEYVTTRWWPAWKDQHPSSEYGTRKKVEKRILPTFGDIPLGELDPSTIGKWKGAMVAEGLTARTVNTYLSLLGTILNAAVDDDYLARSPLVRKSGAGRTAATRNQPVPRREVWLLREQLDRLVEAIDPRYRALVLVVALTGLRWGELAALRWDDPRLDQPLDDGAVRGPGRLRIARAISDPRRTGHGVEKGPKTEAGKRVIALDQETVQALLAHRELVGGGPYDRIFTSPGGSRGPAGTLVHRNFIRVWKRALAKAELAHLWPEYGGLHFHDLRHTHATWLIAQRVPMIAVAGRLGHANAVVTMMVYAHVDKLVDRGLLTVDELGLTAPAPAPVVTLAPRAG
jgi:integrase